MSLHQIALNFLATKQNKLPRNRNTDRCTWLYTYFSMQLHFSINTELVDSSANCNALWVIFYSGYMTECGGIIELEELGLLRDGIGA